MLLDDQYTIGTVCTIYWFTDQTVAKITEISKTRKSFWVCDFDPDNTDTAEKPIPKKISLGEKKIRKWRKVSYSEKRQSWVTRGKRVEIGVSKPYRCPEF